MYGVHLVNPFFSVEIPWVSLKHISMNQTNQLQGESHSNLLFKEKVLKNQTQIFED